MYGTVARVISNKPRWVRSFDFLYLLCFLRLAHSFSLFALFFRLPSFVFNNFRTLSAKHPGWHTPSGTRPLHRSAKMPLCQSFPCHSYALTRDGVPTASLPSFASAVTCATCRLYPLWPQSIAHTSRRHGVYTQLH